jgi:hypothetical protein
VDLAAPRLIEAGRRLPDGRAAFLVAGLDGQEVKLHEFTFQYVPDGSEMPPGAVEPAKPELRALAFGGSSVPSRILARYGAQAEIELVWVAEQEGETRIWSRRYGPDGAPKLLLTRHEPVSTLALGDSAAAAMFGTTLVSIPLSGQVQPSEWQFDGDGTDWTIAVSGAEPTVMARRGQELLCWWPPSTAPQAVIARDAGRATQIHLAALQDPDKKGHRIWASWVDPEKGIQHRAVR